jgi:hypothetical protein
MEKNDENFASCTTRNDAVFRHFFFQVIRHDLVRVCSPPNSVLFMGLIPVVYLLHLPVFLEAQGKRECFLSCNPFPCESSVRVYLLSKREKRSITCHITVSFLKEAHSVSFENFYLVMFYGNQII